MTTILVMGAAGYLGQAAVREAVAAGHRVRGLVRRVDGADKVKALGGEPVMGDVLDVGPWKASLDGVDVLVDLVQPALPKRITRTSIEAVAKTRVAGTRAVGAAVMAMAEDKRPLYLSVGGCDELATASDGTMGDKAPLRMPPQGGGRIGVPVHAMLRELGVRAAFVYFGIVYGPGKAFASTILPEMKKRKLPIIGSGKNRLPIIHVEDAARVLSHLAGLGRDAIAGTSFVAAQPGGSTAETFFNAIAAGMGVRPPRHVPAWLVGIIAGAGAVELMATDGDVKPEGLLASGFSFRYPAIDGGVRAMLDAYARTTPGSVVS